MVFLKEYINPFLDPVREKKDTDETWAEKIAYGKELEDFIAFMESHKAGGIFSNPRARSFYVKWLAQYGDDSIAQMAGAHLVYAGLSQIAIKHLEDQRIGLAPIEKSTRYVNYGKKVAGRFLYYTDPTIEKHNLREKYEKAMDGLFETYSRLVPALTNRLAKKFPDEKMPVVEKKAFDTLRGLLPLATLSQVAFFGNGQAFEHLINRSRRHRLGEIRWAASRASEELEKIIPSFLRRLKDEEKREIVESYQEYLAGKKNRVASHFAELRISQSPAASSIKPPADDKTPVKVRLIEYDPEGEAKVITGILYGTAKTHLSWGTIFDKVKKMNADEKRKILDSYLEGRSARWQKVGRAFENAYLRFEIIMNIGGWRDLHRHRMLTQDRQYFSFRHGYDLPDDVSELGLADEFQRAIAAAEDVFEKIESRDPELAQYAATLSHRLRFMQWKNLRECFWEMELRSIPEGHPDYRHIEQEKFKLLKEVYPLIAERMLVNMGEYDFARRGQEEKIEAKLAKLEEKMD